MCIKCIMCIYIYYKLNIYCTYIPNSEVPPAVRAGCHGRMMEENLMWPWLTLFRMKEVRMPDSPIEGHWQPGLGRPNILQAGLWVFHGRLIIFFEVCGKSMHAYARLPWHALSSFSELSGRGWLGFIKTFSRLLPRRDPKIVLWEEESRFVWDALWVWVCDGELMRAEAEGLLIIVSALMCRMSLAIP